MFERGRQRYGVSPRLARDCRPKSREGGAAHFAKDRSKKAQFPPKATWQYRPAGSDRVRIPVKAKKSGSNSTETSMSRRSRKASCHWGTRGKDIAGEKSAEQRMDADLVGSGGGEQGSGYHHTQ